MPNAKSLSHPARHAVQVVSQVLRASGRETTTYNFRDRVFAARVVEPPKTIEADVEDRLNVEVKVVDIRDTTHTMIITGAKAQARCHTAPGLACSDRASPHCFARMQGARRMP